MDKQREEFEAWYVKTYPFASTMPGKFEREGGDYTDTTVNVAWQAFQYPQAAQPAATVPDQMQDWKGMDGTTAWHLIERHADNLADVGKMMGEWLAANQAAAPSTKEPGK